MHSNRIGGLSGNVRCSSSAHWTARRRLPISHNWTFLARCFRFVTIHAFDRQTDRHTDKISTARCDLTKLDAHKKWPDCWLTKAETTIMLVYQRHWRRSAADVLWGRTLSAARCQFPKRSYRWNWMPTHTYAVHADIIHRIHCRIGVARIFAAGCNNSLLPILWWPFLVLDV